MSLPQAPYKDTAEASRIYLLPCLFTAGNLFFGFLSVIRCIQAKYSMLPDSVSSIYYTQAVWLILLACVCDVFDGLAARISGKESLFGKEFDSLADLVSFGIAPALMVFFFILSPTEGYPFFRQVGWFVGFIYLLCAAVRLARFNVLSSPFLPPDPNTANIKGFIGLPVPAAAGMIASLLLVLNEFDLQRWAFLVLGLMVLIALLMVSHIPYPSLKSLNWRAQARFWNFLLLVLLVSLLFILGQFAFALIFLSYIFFGLTRYYGNKLNIKIFQSRKNTEEEWIEL